MLYEDDFEFEEQPANVRDRAIPGKGGRGSRGGGTRTPRGRGNGAGRRRASAAKPLPESAKPAQDLLEEILTKMGVSGVEIVYIPRSEGEYLEVTGPDLAMLIGRRGNTLEALNLLFNNIINAGVRTDRKYYTIDAEGYRAERAEELQELAIAARDRVLRDQKPYRFEPMLPSERKIMHLALADDERVRTESTGAEPERFLTVFPQ